MQQKEIHERHVLTSRQQHTHDTAFQICLLKKLSRLLDAPEVPFISKHYEYLLDQVFDIYLSNQHFVHHILLDFEFSNTNTQYSVTTF